MRLEMFIVVFIMYSIYIMIFFTKNLMSSNVKHKRAAFFIKYNFYAL